MKLNIGTKLIGGFLFVSLLVALAGGLGIYNVGVVGQAGDIILHDKVPVADMSMEGTIDIISARDSLGEILLSEEEEKINNLHGEFIGFNSSFDNRMNAILKGDPTAGVKAVDPDSKVAKTVDEVEKIHDAFEENAKELLTHHLAHIGKKKEATKLMETFDSLADQLNNGLANYEASLTQVKGRAIDKRVDASMEAKALMFQMKSIVEEYMALENASKKQLREEFMQLTKEFEKHKQFLTNEIIQAYEDFKGIVITEGQMFDIKDQSIADQTETLAHMNVLDSIGGKIDTAMAEVEKASGDDMVTAMNAADSAETTSRVTLIAVTLIALLVGIFIGVFITRSITQPLGQCVELAQQVAAGDLTQQITVNSNDETRDLADALNGMVGKLGDMIGRIRSTSTSVASAADEISAATDQITKGAATQASAADETSSSMEEMSVNIMGVAKNAEGLASNVDETTSSIQQMGTAAEGVARNAEGMASNVSETSSTIEQMVVSIDKTAENVQKADKLSELARNEANSGGEAVMKTVEGMRNISDMMGNITEVIRSLGTRSEAIGGIVEVIEEIADQTNLLALNAAIEAARAGDAGKGFAVVADEVRKLAERSIKATKEIGEVIKLVQKETATAVQATEQGAGSAKEGIALADQAGSAITRIVEAVNSNSSIMKEISSATNEQSTAAKNVIKAVEDMNALTQSVMQATKEQASGVQQVVKAAENMSQMTLQVKNATSEQKKGGDNVVKAVENISEIAKSNLSAVEQLSRSARDMATQSEGLQELVQMFNVA